MVSTLQCRNVRKSFILEDKGAVWRILFNRDVGKRFEALKDVTVDVPKGEFVGILGRNGAGKSTLLRAIGGVYAPDSGVIVINGDMSALYELGMMGNEHLTGREFAGRWFDVFATPKDNRRALIADVHDFSELEEAFDRPIRGYSAGMRARLNFSLATARASDIFIIDEVLSVGDEYFQNKCWRRIRQRLSGGAAGIIATHDWSAVLRLCSTAYVIEKGRTIAHGPSPGVVRDYLGLSTEEFASGARFDPALPDVLRGHSFEDFTLEMSVTATEVVEIKFGAAVEVFVPGFGWEHVMHADPQPVGVGPGKFRIQLRIPALPLKEGEYAISVSISKSNPDGGQKVLDARAWTYNQALTLKVDGPDSRGAVRWPVTLATPARQDMPA